MRKRSNVIRTMGGAPDHFSGIDQLTNLVKINHSADSASAPCGVQRELLLSQIQPECRAVWLQLGAHRPVRALGALLALPSQQEAEGTAGAQGAGNAGPKRALGWESPTWDMLVWGQNGHEGNGEF